MTKLAAYRAKRDFRKTPEPAGASAGDRGGGGRATAPGLAFVIQKHDASRLHYDLRLELDGVMKSWAVAKGPSLVAGEKRLAIHVEDHPIEYNAFEGRIPKGQYGGGTVLLWDRGAWEPVFDAHKGYAKGHLEFRLDGEKLGGGWHLVRMRKKAGEKQEPWLLIKAEDAFARTADEPDILEEKPLSVASGRDLAAIAAETGGAVWTSDRGAGPDAPATAVAAEPTKGRRRTRTALPVAAASAPGSGAPPNLSRLIRGGRKAGMPPSVEPCLATLAAAPPRGDKWLHEVKWDGYRLLARKDKDGTRLLTRRGQDWTHRFPAIAAAVDALPVATVILDGEAIVEDAGGTPSFSALQNALSDEGGGVARAAALVGFDLLYVEGRDLREMPLEARKAALAALLPAEGGGPLRYGEHLEVDGEAMLRSACGLGLEGIMSKRRDRPYRSGRSADWLKVKCSGRQDFVVAGYVPSKAAARAVGSLVLAYHQDGELRHAGRAGTGYTAESARSLWTRLEAIRAPRAPFRERLGAEERRGVVWVEPTLVAEIEFRGWTGDDRLRHAAFKGLREDKAAAEVVREGPVGDGAAGGPDRDAPAEGPAPSRGVTRGPARGSAVAGVTLSHPERVLWPDCGLTKLGLAEFYEEVADWILPQVAGRPLSLVRCPDGVESSCFFQKHAWAGMSEHVRRGVARDTDGEEEFVWVEDVRGIVALAQASVLEIHPWGARAEAPDRPDRIVMDLDPGDGIAWADVVAGAREVRDRLKADGLESFVKTTGGKGLHVVVPLDASAGWAAAKAYAHALSLAMEKDSPARYLAKASKEARRGRIYVDYLRNGQGATAVAAYSTRARPGAPVAVPVAWRDLTASLDPRRLTVATVPARLARLRQDPWADLPRLAQRLPAPAKGRR